VNTPDRLYIFAISITPSAVPSTVPTGPELSIRSVQFSACWEDVIGQRVQAVAITLANLLPGSLASSPNTLIHFKYEVEVTGEGVTTVTPGMVYRLVVADQARFDVLVLNNNGSGTATVTIKDSNGNVVATSSGWLITPLRQTWTADESVLSTHEPPTWVCCFLRQVTVSTLIPVEPSKIRDIVSTRRDALETSCSHALAFTGVSIAFQLM
jgi:alpha-L-fucosidase